MLTFITTLFILSKLSGNENVFMSKGLTGFRYRNFSSYITLNIISCPRHYNLHSKGKILHYFLVL